MHDRIAHPGLAARRMTAEQAASLIQPGMSVGMSGFTGAGYPKAVPLALAGRISAAQERGEDFGLRILTGASTAPELDGALARAGGAHGNKGEEAALVAIEMADLRRKLQEVAP